MTDTEHFLSRWSRLKNGTAEASAADRVADAESSIPTEGEAVDMQAVSRRPQPPEEAGPAFDPATLPSIESITIDTDIRGFLQSRVPAELTRAALRRAWTSDPAICNFVGIAENQWDFNDPTAIFGFGPMRGTDDLPALLSQALGQFEKLAGSTGAVMADAAPPAAGELQADSGSAPAGKEQTVGAPGEDTVVAAGGQRDAADDDRPAGRRKQGGALPR